MPVVREAVNAVLVKEVAMVWVHAATASQIERYGCCRVTIAVYMYHPSKVGAVMV